MLALILASPSVHSTVSITISGVNETQDRNIRQFVGLPEDTSPRRLKRFIESIPANADKALQSEGYYNALYDIEKKGVGDSTTVLIRVTPGQPVRINALTVDIENDAREDNLFMTVTKRLPISSGQVFTHANYENSKTLLINTALDRGYFDFQFVKSEVRISRKNSTAAIILVADSGFRYTFAGVEFKSDYFADDFLRRYIPFQQGDYYESKTLANVTRQMQNSGFFNKVKVLPKRGIEYGKQVPIVVEVERKQKNYIGIGLGFATDTEWRTKLTWSKPVVNKSGHSFDSALGVSKVEQDLTFQYRIPRVSNPLYNYWSIEYGIKNFIDDDIPSLLNTVNLRRVKRNKRGWTESLFIRWERERYEKAGERDQTDLLLPGISFSKNKSQGQPFPTRGYNANFQFLYGSKDLLSDIDLYKGVASYKYLRSFADRNTLIFSVQYGVISSNNFGRVPISQLFFAGGDRSIRGFDYRSVSPRNSAGLATGGRFLEVGSLEYNHRVRERWAGALFVDAGRAYNNIDEPYSVGAGFGVRWFSPVGPFRVDLAWDVSEDDPGVTVHLSIGPDI